MSSSHLVPMNIPQQSNNIVSVSSNAAATVGAVATAKLEDERRRAFAEHERIVALGMERERKQQDKERHERLIQQEEQRSYFQHHAQSSMVHISYILTSHTNIDFILFVFRCQDIKNKM